MVRLERLKKRAAARKGMEIGELEAEVLRVLKGLGKASAGELTVEIQREREVAYTTISTTLDRLFKKGLVSREAVAGKTGPKYVYSIVNDPELEKQLVDAAVGKLVDAFGPSVAASIYERLNEISPGELQTMRDTIEKRRKKEG
jgi:predicted transcriptional regulator